MGAIPLRTRIAAAAALTLLLLAPATTSAQGITAGLDELKQRREEALDDAQTIARAPATSSIFALPVPEVTLQTTKDGTAATAVIGVATPFRSLRLTFKTPIGKEDDARAEPLTLAGLANEASVDIAVISQRVFRRFVTSNGVAMGIDDVRLAFCDERGILPSSCSDQAFNDKPELREQFLNFGVYPHPMLSALHLRVGGSTFKYVEKGKSSETKTSHASVAAGGALGWMFLQQQSLLSVAMNVARQYTASEDKTTLCMPLETDVAGTSRCDERILGVPAEASSVTGTVEYRMAFSRTHTLAATPGSDGKPAVPPPVPQQSRPVVGLALQFSVKAEQDKKAVWGFDAPLYFLQRPVKDTALFSLNGGVTSGWNSKDGFVVQVFIGNAFSLLGSDFGNN